MLHVCDQRFDVTGNLENFYELNKAWKDFGFWGELNKALFKKQIRNIKVLW